MAEQIRIISDCDGLIAAHAGSQILVRLGAGTELRLLRDDDRDFYKVAFAGRPVFVAKPAATLVEGDEDTEAWVLPGSRPSPPAPRPAGVRRARPIRRRGGGGVPMPVRVIAFVIGLGMVISGVGLLIAAAPSVIAPESEVSLGYGLGLGGVGLLAVAATVIWFTFRPALQFVLMLTGVILAIGGFELLVFAVPIVRMTSADIDPDRAKLALPIAGIALLVAGVTLTAVALARWLRNPQSRRRWPQVARWSAIVFGGLLVLSGSGGPSSLALSAEGYTPTVEDAAFLGAIVLLTVLPGAILGYHGLTMTSRRGEGQFRFLPAGALYALFAGAIALGAVVVAVGEPMVWLMSGAHMGAALVPAVALIALASRGGLGLSRPAAGLSHRQVWVALALGIAVVTLVAGLLDGFLAEALAMGILATSGAFDGLRNGGELGEVLANADLYLSRGEEALLLVVVVVCLAPIMEEGFKALGLTLVLPRRPTPTVALTLGIAVGAGFGVLEASIYGLGSFYEESGIEWWMLMLIRGGATSMHALNTGLLGLALYYDRSEGRFRRAFLLYLGAVALHGLWNGLAVLAGSRVIFTFEGLTDSQFMWVAFGLMMALSIAVLSVLYIVARSAYRASPKVGEETEAASPPSSGLPLLEPWLR